MPTIVKPFSVCAVLLLTLSACSKFGGQDEMAWARTALDRNQRLEVVAADDQAKTFTVRVKDSGKLFVVPLDHVVAGPEELFDALPKQASADAGAAPAGAAAPGAAGEAQGASQGPAPANAAPGTTAPATTAPGAAPASTAPSSTPDQPSGPASLASAGEPAQMPGGGAASSSGESDAAPAGGQVQGPHAESARNAKVGSVLASGPGYSIKASGPSGTASRQLQVTARGTPVEHIHDTIICQGSRLLHIDNRNLQFDGDAVSAEDGCEIHITNTHISAKGIGVLARAANVHIENSDIEGDSGAIEASDGAQVYAEASHFKGLTRRLESSAFHDLGGNVWN